MKKKHIELILDTLGGAFNIILALLTALIVYMFTVNSYNFGIAQTYNKNKNEPEKEVVIKIPKDASLWDVSRILEDNGLVTSAILFNADSILKNKSNEFAPGEYTLNTKMDFNAINDVIRPITPVSNDITIKIREGYSIRDIAVYLEDMGVVSGEEFINACNNSEFNYAFLRDIPQRENRLEGYLFPDTYFVTKNPTPEQIINKMLTRFDEIYDADMRARTLEMNLSIDQVVTIASIIEKEIRVPEERALASAVVFNRLNQNMNLSMCSTILYVLDKKRAYLLDSDLKVKSPYNTYENSGLPVGPISNPGAACLEAALNPANVDYLYFVIKNEETGEHEFTNSYDRFLAAKSEYKQKY